MTLLMKHRIILILVFFVTLRSTLLADVETNAPKPQVVLLTQKAQNCDWHENMTLAEALTKLGGVGVSTVTLIRNATPERLNLIENMNRPIAPWDIIVAGH
jgi:hypothetical protein